MANVRKQVHDLVLKEITDGQVIEFWGRRLNTGHPVLIGGFTGHELRSDRKGGYLKLEAVFFEDQDGKPSPAWVCRESHGAWEVE